MDASNLNISKPSLKGARVPPGHILVNAKFQRNEIVQFIQEFGMKPLIQDGLGIVDFYPSNQFAVIWVPEEVIVTNEASLEKKLLKLAKGFCNGIACIQVTDVSHQYYKKLQLFSVDICNVTLIPVKSVKEMTKFLAYLTYNEASSNQKHRSIDVRNLDEDVLGTMKVIQGVGEKKATELLKKFTSMAEICDASSEDLKNIVGGTIAQSVKSLFEIR